MVFLFVVMIMYGIIRMALYIVKPIMMYVVLVVIVRIISGLGLSLVSVVASIIISIVHLYCIFFILVIIVFVLRLKCLVFIIVGSASFVAGWAYTIREERKRSKESELRIKREKASLKVLIFMADQLGVDVSDEVDIEDIE